ncbi:MAG: Na+/H+ antiporter subunit E [Bacillota bacterium]|nr:Na+/H+ antiporter subunit E [Bacillota bacterium]
MSRAGTQIGLNILLAFIWTMLHTSYTIQDFVSGYIVGALLIYLLNTLIMRNRFYMRRLFLAFQLLLIFFWELIKACCQVLYQVFQPQLKIKPGIIKMDIYLESDAEITLLANMITLTPGTMTVEVAEDHSALYIHTLVIEDADAICAGIEKSFEQHIREVFE